MKHLALLALLALFAGGAAACHSHPDGFCLDHGHVCFGGKIHICPDKCRCSGKWPCRMPTKTPSCTHMPNYVCVDDKHFCLGHKKMRCADGTWCQTTGTDRITPCWRTSPPPRSCHAHMKCLTSKSYCHNGHMHHCPSGWRCFGWGPCVKPL